MKASYKEIKSMEMCNMETQTSNKKFWHSVLWFDEIKLCLIGSDGRYTVWKQPP